ncbi:MAG: IS1634 family transposase [bacterium]|nr:IS1634 family transposase [bacterium]
MYIESVPNRNSPPAILLRESYRDAGKVKKRTLANLSKWPPALVNDLRTLLQGGTAVADPGDAFDIHRSLPHGHVAAVLGSLKKLHLDRTIAGTASPERERVLALITARILNPGSKLATARGLAAPTARDSLAATLGLGDIDEDDLYAAMDWLLKRQDAIEQRLAKRHLKDGALVLYDLTSVYLEGRRCPLAKHGYSRDGKRGKLQIEFGLLCDREGCPVAVEVFDGNTSDPATVGVQVDKLRGRFGLSRVVLVGDRGMLTEARIREDVRPAGLDWISALRASAIRELVASGAVQMSLFDETDLIEIQSPDYPGERLMVCRNPSLADERARKREDLLQATEALLDPIAAATKRDQRRLQGKDKIGLRVGKAIGKYKMAKHFELDISDDSFGYRRKLEAIAAEAALDGLYVVRTSLPTTELNAAETVQAYKSLSAVERAFRSLKTVDLKVRPIYHHAADRVRAHVFLCMLAYYVEWHMRERLKPLLFEDDDPDAAARTSIVAPAEVSPSARDKARRKRTAAGWPVHSFRTLLDDLATIARNRVVARQAGAEPFEVVTRPTALQREAFKLLGVRLDRTQ